MLYRGKQKIYLKTMKSGLFHTRREVYVGTYAKYDLYREKFEKHSLNPTKKIEEEFLYIQSVLKFFAKRSCR